MESLRIGLLGAATIAPVALLRPARQVEQVAVTAVAARDPRRARAFANRHNIPLVHQRYDDLLADSTVDAVYIPLPNGLHGAWTLRALAAGKHVLCEKPFTANAAEAGTVAEAAGRTDRVVMEAFHYRYHPLAERILTIIASGELGDIRHLEARMCIPLPRFSDIRYNLGLAGGALMDAGCYAMHALRTFGPSEPRVDSAVAKQHGAGVDRAMRIELSYPGGVTGRVITSMWSARLLDISLRIVGELGSLRVLNFAAPHLYHRLTVRAKGGRRHERVPGRSSYACQLTAFRDAVRSGGPVLTDAADAVPTMALIDAGYLAAGLRPRQPTPVD